MLVPLLLLALQSPAPPPASTTADAAAPTSVPRLFVLDLVPNGVEPATVVSIGGVVSSLVSECAGATSVNSAELRSLTSMESTRQSAGCTEGSCLAELADALGARYVVSGDVGRLAEHYVVNLTLFDAEQGASRGRRSVEINSLERVADELRPAVNELLAPLGGIPLQARPLSTLVPVGGVVAGVGVLALGVGTALTLVADNTASTPTETVEAKNAAINQGRVMLLVAGAGGAAVLAGAGVMLAGAMTE
jgi:hypothetical protein